jgi:hypothetical protein
VTRREEGRPAGLAGVIDGIDLTAVLLFISVVELALNRLAVPVLYPGGDQPVPWWHHLDRIGLFVFHLTSLFALGIMVFRSWEVSFRRTMPAVAPAIGVVVSVFGLLALVTIVVRRPYAFSFGLESLFTTVLLVLGGVLVLRRTRWETKVGYFLLLIPFLVHYYGTFVLRVLLPTDTAAGSPLPIHVREVGQWVLAVCAVGAAICFAPRPWRLHLARPTPAVLALFVGVISAIILYRHYEVAMEIASRGLGIEFGPAAPPTMLVAYCIAAAAVTWTLVATMTSDQPGERQIGLGFALVAVGGYAYHWPLQMMTAVAGALAIVDSGQPHAAPQAAPVTGRGPAIAPEVWRRYVDEVARAIEATTVEVVPVEGIESTRIMGTRDGMPYLVRVMRPARGIHSVEIAFGSPLPGDRADEPPPWLMVSRPAPVARHARAPGSPSPVVRTGDASFDDRFRVHDDNRLVDKLFDEPLRARASALLDGWLAVWPRELTLYRVCPGSGAPEDGLIPVSDLAQTGVVSRTAAERMINVFTLLGEIARRALDAEADARPV